MNGDRLTQEVRWRNANPLDPVEGSVHAQALTFDKRLTRLRYPHAFDDYGPGGHEWFYWQRDLRQVLPALVATFADPPATPKAFVYRKADPDDAVYGWTVHVEGAAMEFSELRVFSRTRFTLAGSGAGTVTTGRLFRKRTRVVATVGTAKQTLVADAKGRVRLSVPLGPPNASQQYTVGTDTRVFATKVTLSGRAR